MSQNQAKKGTEFFGVDSGHQSNNQSSNQEQSTKNSLIKTQLETVQFRNSPNVLLKEGNVILEQIINNLKSLNESCRTDNIRIKYISQKTKHRSTKRCLKVEITPSSFSNQQIFQSNILKKYDKVELDMNRQSFTVGNQKNEMIQLSDNLKEITANVIYNDICLQDQALAPIHLEVNYSSLTQNNNFKDQLNVIESNLWDAGIKQSISYKTIESISNYLQKNKKKLKIADISGKISSTFIQIVKGLEHSILEEGQKFKVGFQPSLKVEKRCLKLIHFFKKYSNKNHNNNIDLIFDALQSFPQKIFFAGIDIVLAELFMLVQERDINRKQYLERFDDDNLMLFNKVEQMLQKSCILMKTEGDANRIENFMLVADQKRSFNFGRMEFSDISFSSSQVSRQHGLIEYNQELDQWTIMDGVYENDRWKPSTFGLWLEIQQEKYYYIDNNQPIKMGNNNLLRFDAENCSFTNAIVNEESYQQDYYYKQNIKEIDEFLINLLEI